MRTRQNAKAFCLLLLLSLPALAMNLSEAMSGLSAAKSSGLVGEQPNGYLGAVKDTAQSREIVSLINQARRAEYQKVAAQNNISMQDVEKIAGQKAIEKTAAGLYIQRNGAWIQK